MSMFSRSLLLLNLNLNLSLNLNLLLLQLNLHLLLLLLHLPWMVPSPSPIPSSSLSLSLVSLGGLTPSPTIDIPEIFYEPPLGWGFGGLPVQIFVTISSSIFIFYV